MSEPNKKKLFAYQEAYLLWDSIFHPYIFAVDQATLEPLFKREVEIVSKLLTDSNISPTFFKTSITKDFKTNVSLNQDDSSTFIAQTEDWDTTDFETGTANVNSCPPKFRDFATGFLDRVKARRGQNIPNFDRPLLVTEIVGPICDKAVNTFRREHTHMVAADLFLNGQKVFPGLETNIFFQFDFDNILRKNPRFHTLWEASMFITCNKIWLRRDRLEWWTSVALFQTARVQLAKETQCPLDWAHDCMLKWLSKQSKPYPAVLKDVFVRPSLLHADTSLSSAGLKLKHADEESFNTLLKKPKPAVEHTSTLQATQFSIEACKLIATASLELQQACKTALDFLDYLKHPTALTVMEEFPDYLRYRWDGIREQLNKLGWSTTDFDETLKGILSNLRTLAPGSQDYVTLTEGWDSTDMNVWTLQPKPGNKYSDHRTAFIDNLREKRAQSTAYPLPILANVPISGLLDALTKQVPPMSTEENMFVNLSRSWVQKVAWKMYVCDQDDVLSTNEAFVSRLKMIVAAAIKANKTNWWETFEKFEQAKTDIATALGCSKTQVHSVLKEDLIANHLLESRVWILDNLAPMSSPSVYQANLNTALLPTVQDRLINDMRILGDQVK